VDGREVHDWHEANQVLRELARTAYDEACREAAMQGTTLPIEAEGRTIRITYASRRAGLLSGSIPQESVLVRTFLPKTIEYSRSGITELARYEIVRDDVTQ
jgi:hypothetical protein